MTTTDREDLARIIDPSSWRVLDSYLAIAVRSKPPRNDLDNFKDQASLAIADAIIAAGWTRQPRADLLAQIETLTLTLDAYRGSLYLCEADRRAIDTFVLPLPTHGGKP